MTSTFAHRSVLLHEAIDALSIKPSGTYVDGTYGGGGHSLAILAQLGPQGRLLALDQDPRAVALGRQSADARLQVLHQSFGQLEAALAAVGIPVVGGVDGVLLDIGVSSPQLDDGARGFSFRYDAPLDMRMDTTRGETVAQWLLRADVEEITEVIRNYGEERFAFQIAKKIVAVRRERPLATTGQLAALVRQTVRTRESGQDPATRTFQALRIHINQELEQLALVLPQAINALKSGGRLAVICFHSLEDRIVKRFLRCEAHPDQAPRKIPLRHAELPLARLRLVGKPIKASEAEVAVNPRARSAVMRVAEKLALQVA